MDNRILTVDEGTACTAWNHSGQRLAAGLNDGTLFIYDSTDAASSVFSCTSRFKVQEGCILKVVWVPPLFGDAIACISDNGTLSLWEEVSGDTEGNQWKLCKSFERNTSQVLDAQFGDCHTSLKLVAAFADGQVKIFDLLDMLDLKKWQLQIKRIEQKPSPGHFCSLLNALTVLLNRPYELIAVELKRESESGTLDQTLMLMGGFR